MRSRRPARTSSICRRRLKMWMAPQTRKPPEHSGLYLWFYGLSRSSHFGCIDTLPRQADNRANGIPGHKAIQYPECGESVQAASPIRVMLVEDFQPFRGFVWSQLEQRPRLQVVCEVSDGLIAVQKAAELKPDLILLDIGLPTLNGFEAARRILVLAPESKIIFSSQQTSPDFVQEAMELGAWGFVFKTHAERDLLLAIDAVLSGRRFVSSNGMYIGHLVAV
jgi:CheY-like chemotaxis protein